MSRSHSEIDNYIIRMHKTNHLQEVVPLPDSATATPQHYPSVLNKKEEVVWNDGA